MGSKNTEISRTSYVDGPQGEGDHPPIELRSDDRLRSIHVSLPPNAVAIKSEQKEEAETKHVAEIMVGDVVIVVVDAAFVLTALFMANLLIFSTSSASLTLTPSFPCRARASPAASDEKTEDVAGFNARPARKVRANQQIRHQAHICGMPL